MMPRHNRLPFGLPGTVTMVEVPRPLGSRGERPSGSSSSTPSAQLATLKGVEVDADRLKMVFVQLLDYQELIDFQAGLYAKYYAVDEMAALAKFYSTPLGKKSLSVIPQLTQDIAGWMMNKIATPETEKMMKSAIRKAPAPTEKGARAN